MGRRQTNQRRNAQILFHSYNTLPNFHFSKNTVAISYTKHINYLNSVVRSRCRSVIWPRSQLILDIMNSATWLVTFQQSFFGWYILWYWLAWHFACTTFSGFQRILSTSKGHTLLHPLFNGWGDLNSKEIYSNTINFSWKFGHFGPR